VNRFGLIFSSKGNSEWFQGERHKPQSSGATTELERLANPFDDAAVSGEKDISPRYPEGLVKL